MLRISSGDQVFLFKENQIVRFESNKETTTVYFADETTSEIYIPVETIKNQIASNNFIQIHQNHLVNVNFITSIPNQEPGYIEINNNHLLPISKEQYEIIVQLISEHLNT